MSSWDGMSADIVAVEVWGNSVFPLSALKRPLALSRIIETWPRLWSVIVTWQSHKSTYNLAGSFDLLQRLARSLPNRYF